MLLARRVDPGPGPGASCPDVHSDFHAGGIVQRSSPDHQRFRGRRALAVDRRTAVAAEIAIQRSAAVGSRSVELRRALRDFECRARNHRVDAASGARCFLAVRAVAGAKLGDRDADGVTNGAAEAASGLGACHRGCPWLYIGCEFATARRRSQVAMFALIPVYARWEPAGRCPAL